MTQEHDDTGTVATRDPADDAQGTTHGTHRAPGGRRPAVLALVAALVLALVAGIAVIVATSGDDTPTAAPAPAPRPAPAARPAPPPSPLLGLVDAQFSTRRVSDLEQVFENSGNDGLVERGPLPQIVPNPDDPRRQAWRFTLGPGGKRSEVLPEGPGTRPTDGDVQWVRYTAILDRGFPTTTDGWQLILQWHHDSPDGSPPLALQVTQGQLMMVAGGVDKKAISPVAPGQRVDLVMRVVFSRTPGRGAVTVWRDGRPTGVTDWRPPEGTMITRGAYLKMGLYRSTDIDTPGTVTATDLVLGPTARSVGGTGPLPPR